MILRILSLAISGWYLYGAYSRSGQEAAIKIGLFLLVPLSFIWFSRILSRIIGSVVPGKPGGCFIKLVGWILLLIPFLYPFVIKITEGK